MSLLDYEALERVRPACVPCPYLVVEDFVPPEALKTLLAHMPDISGGGSFAPQSLDLAAPMREFIREFRGPRLKKIIGAKFGMDLEKAPEMVTIRGRTRPKDGRIHLDSKSKKVTILLYLNPPEMEWKDGRGCLRFTKGPGDVRDYYAEIPPRGGTLVVFPNHPGSWHGHLPYEGPRATLQLNYMFEGRRAKAENLRHRLTAVMKRIFS